MNYIGGFDIPNNIICDMMKSLSIYNKEMVLQQCQNLYEDGDLNGIVEFAKKMELSYAHGICFEIASFKLAQGELQEAFEYACNAGQGKAASSLCI